jgi:carbonic anhydrase
MDQSRRELLKMGLAAAAVGAGMVSGAGPAAAQAGASVERTPDAALKALVEGNARFVEEQKTGGSGRGSTRRLGVAPAQHPFASILACADSRVPVEILFDQGLGDLFVVRVAGNTVGLSDHNVIGSLEFSHAVLGAPLIMVLGHSSCGAVDAALKTINEGGDLPGSIEHMVDTIRPAARKSKAQGGTSLEAATDMNVRVAVDRLKQSHPILAPAVEKGALKIVGAVYDLKSGEVLLLD